MKVLQKLPNFEINFHRSGIKTYNFVMIIICSIIFFILLLWSFSFLNAIRILKVLGHYINRKMQYSTARTAVKNGFIKTDNSNLYQSCLLQYI